MKKHFSKRLFALLLAGALACTPCIAFAQDDDDITNTGTESQAVIEEEAQAPVTEEAPAVEAPAEEVPAAPAVETPAAPAADSQEVSAAPAEETPAAPAEEVSAVPAEETPVAPAEAAPANCPSQSRVLNVEYRLYSCSYNNFHYGSYDVVYTEQLNNLTLDQTSYSGNAEALAAAGYVIVDDRIFLANKTLSVNPAGLGDYGCNFLEWRSDVSPYSSVPIVICNDTIVFVVEKNGCIHDNNQVKVGFKTEDGTIVGDSAMMTVDPQVGSLTLDKTNIPALPTGYDLVDPNESHTVTYTFDGNNWTLSESEVYFIVKMDNQVKVGFKTEDGTIVGDSAMMAVDPQIGSLTLDKTNIPALPTGYNLVDPNESHTVTYTFDGENWTLSESEVYFIVKMENQVKVGFKTEDGTIVGDSAMMAVDPQIGSLTLDKTNIPALPAGYNLVDPNESHTVTYTFDGENWTLSETEVYFIVSMDNQVKVGFKTEDGAIVGDSAMMTVDPEIGSLTLDKTNIPDLPTGYQLVDEDESHTVTYSFDGENWTLSDKEIYFIVKLAKITPVDPKPVDPKPVDPKPVDPTPTTPDTPDNHGNKVTPSTGNQVKDTVKANTSAKVEKKTVKTGDNANIILYVIIAGVCIAVGFTTLKVRKSINHR